MHEIIRRYSQKSLWVNSFTLFLFKISPHIVREYAVRVVYVLRKRKKLKTKFLIFAQGRTGSTLLVDLINSHPGVFSMGEIMDSRVVKRLRNPRQFAEGLCRLSSKDVAGFKVKIYQIEAVQDKEPHEFLREFADNGWKVVYLVRRNVLRHAISDIRSDKTGQYHNIAGDQSDASGASSRGSDSITISLEELKKTISFREDCIRKEELALQNIPHLMIEYERDLLDPDTQTETLKKVFAFLELEDFEAKTQFKKVASKSMGDDVANFKELEAYLQSTEYSRFIDWG